jgi:hypothetical protein
VVVSVYMSLRWVLVTQDVDHQCNVVVVDENGGKLKLKVEKSREQQHVLGCRKKNEPFLMGISPALASERTFHFIELRLQLKLPSYNFITTLNFDKYVPQFLPIDAHCILWYCNTSETLLASIDP